ncbi:MAG: phosphate signaling complex protein PhoU [Verrucomicrobiales bacterium]
MTESTHLLGSFEKALQDARNNVLRMASIAEQNLENAVNGLLTRNQKLCNEAIAEEDEVNSLERRIDAEAFEILMRFNPVAGDLREVIAGMKVANNLERISDEARNIAKRARKIMEHPEIEEALMIEPLYDRALSLFRDGMRSYAEGDTELGLSLYDRDRELDKGHKGVIRKLSKRMDKDSSALKVKSFLHLVFIVRSLERIGDHAVNIAEDGIFLEEATDVRHLGPERAAEEIEAN